MKIEEIQSKCHDDVLLLQSLFNGNFWFIQGNQFDWFGRGGLQLSNMNHEDWGILTDLCSPEMQNISSVNISSEDLIEATLPQIYKLWMTLKKRTTG